MNDLVGRCIAEQTSAAASYAVTLTYAGDGPETAMLRYRDVQLMLKLIRRRGFSVRYIVAGEFGTKKGRAHWHAVLFFSCVGPTGPMPIPREGNGAWDIRINQRFNWKPWPHGYAFFQEPDYGGFAYVLKYALKDQDADVSKGHLAMSKKPPLGHDYFMERAQAHVMQGLAPQDLFYSFGNVFDAKRKRRRFLMQGTTRENFLNRFAEQWQTVHQTLPPLSEELTAHWDKLARQYLADSRTDAAWQAAKRQWPKYIFGSAESMASEDAYHMRLTDPDNWERGGLSAPVPTHLAATLGEYIATWLDGKEPEIEVFYTGETDYWQGPARIMLEPCPIEIFARANGEFRTWRVARSQMQPWLEWFAALGVPLRP